MQRTNPSSSGKEHLHSRLIRPAPRTPLQKIGDFFYDKRYGTCFTRTVVNWFAITVYYVFFLLGVFMIFYISMIISEAVSSGHGDRPYYVLDESPIGSSPALNFFPLKKSKNFLWLTSENKSNSKYAEIINQVFDDYYENSNFDPSMFKACASPPYGYNESAPCIYIRMNRLIGWKPKPYSSRDRLPDNMPEAVKYRIKNSGKQKIWVSCQGTTARDRDHLTQDSFQFQGDGGFDTSSFPYKRTENYLDPIIALKLKTKVRNFLVSFTCEAWAKKLDHRKSKVEVLFYFE